MYTRWLRQYEEFIKNNLNKSDFQLKESLMRLFGFEVSEEAVKKKRQRLRLSKKVGRKKNDNTTIEKDTIEKKVTLNRDI